jgi:cytochrome P450
VLDTFQNKASEELEHIFQGSDRSVTMKDLNEMKYLERVIKESLRIYPSVPTIGREITEDIQLGRLKRKKRIPSIFNDESTRSFICLR